MAKKYDVYKELIEAGFEKDIPMFDGYDELRRDWKDGNRILTIHIIFSPDHEVFKAMYFDGSRKAFKVKAHLNQKRAFNAIRQTVENNWFEF